MAKDKSIYNIGRIIKLKQDIHEQYQQKYVNAYRILKKHPTTKQFKIRNLHSKDLFFVMESQIEGKYELWMAHSK